MEGPQLSRSFAFTMGVSFCRVRFAIRHSRGCVCCTCRTLALSVWAVQGNAPTSRNFSGNDYRRVPCAIQLVLGCMVACLIFYQYGLGQFLFSFAMLNI